MAKHHQISENKRKLKKQSQVKKVKPPVIEELTDDLTGLTKLPGRSIAAAGGSTIEAQAARLSDPHLQTAQRQVLAAQIGRGQGNQHLQRVIASLKQNEKPMTDRLRSRAGQEIPIDQTVQRGVEKVGENGEGRPMVLEFEQGVQTNDGHELHPAGQASTVTTCPQTPASSSLTKIAHIASEAASDPEVQITFAGSPARQNAPGGLASILSMGGTTSLGVTGGLTLTVNAAAFTAPSFTTRNSVVRRGHQAQHFAEVQPTTSADATHRSYYPGPGYHRRPGVTQRIGRRTYSYYWWVSRQMSSLIRRGEQEHLNDALRAYNITYKLIADQINALVGRRFGPARSPVEADRLAEAALVRRLPSQLGTDPANWVRMLNTLLRATRVRDTNRWHAVSTDPPRTRGNRIIHPVVSTGTTNIDQVPSSQVVNYPTASPGRPAPTPPGRAPGPPPVGDFPEPAGEERLA